MQDAEVAEVVENDVQEETVESASEDEEISSESIEEEPTLVIPEEAPKVLSGEEIYAYISGLDNYTVTSLFDSQLEKNPEESYGYESKMLVTPEIETDIDLKDNSYGYADFINQKGYYQPYDEDSVWVYYVTDYDIRTLESKGLFSEIIDKEWTLVSDEDSWIYEVYEEPYTEQGELGFIYEYDDYHATLEIDPQTMMVKKLVYTQKMTEIYEEDGSVNEIQNQTDTTILSDIGITKAEIPQDVIDAAISEDEYWDKRNAELGVIEDEEEW